MKIKGETPQNSDPKQGKKIIIHADPDIADLIPEFLENRRRDLKSIQEALNRNNYKTIQVLGHRIRGVGKSYGFDIITDIGKSIENAANCKNPEEIQKCIGEFLNYLECVKVVYE